MWAVLAWLVIVFAAYFSQRDSLFEYVAFLFRNRGGLDLWHPYSLKALAAIGLAVWILWVTVKCGESVLSRILPGSAVPRLERRLLSAGLGFGFISLLTFGLGAFRLWYVAVFWAALGLLTAAHFPRKLPPVRLRELGNLLSSEVPKGSTAVMGVLLVAAGSIFLIGGLSPEVFYDSLHYHLGVPNLYLVNHGIYKTPHLALSGFVMSVDMFWGFAITVGDEIVAKMLHASSALLLLFTFIAFERRYLAPRAGLFAALMFLSIPVVGASVTASGIDVAWTALQLLSVFALCRALTEVHDETAVRRWFCLAGLLTGLAASCKYTGFAAIPIASILILWKRRRLSYFLIPALLMVAPYLIKNAVFHLNPLYPIAASYWGEPRLSPENWQSILNDTQSRNLAADFSSPASIVRFVLHPWFITMEGKTGNMDFVGPLLLGLLPVLLMKRAPDKTLGLLARYSAALWVVWLLTASVPRFGMPLLAMTCLLVAHSLFSVKARPFARRAALAISMAGVVSNLYFMLLYNANSENWRVLAGQVSEREYLTDARPTYPAPSYEAIEWMNVNLPPESRVLIVGDARSYRTRLPVVVSSTYNSQPILEIAREAANGSDMARLLGERGITHIFINFAEAVRTESYGVFAWDPQAWSVLEDFWPRYVRLQWVRYRPDPSNLKGLFVFRILPDPENASEPSPNPFERWKPK